MTSIGAFVSLTDPALLPPYRGKKIHFEPLAKDDKAVLVTAVRIRRKKRAKAALSGGDSNG
jgi:hypothetical protein